MDNFFKFHKFCKYFEQPASSEPTYLLKNKINNLPFRLSNVFRVRAMVEITIKRTLMIAIIYNMKKIIKFLLLELTCFHSYNKISTQ